MFRRIRTWLAKHFTNRRLALIGIPLAIVLAGTPWWWPSTSTGSHATNVHGSQNPLIGSGELVGPILHLFDPAALQWKKDLHLNPNPPGIEGTYATCESSLALPSPGVYRCVISTTLTPGAMADDPCFGLTVRAVVCNDGTFALPIARAAPNVAPFNPTVGDFRQRYPYKMNLANGVQCKWDSWDTPKPGATVNYYCGPLTGKGNDFELAVPMYPDGMFDPPNGEVLRFSKVLLATSNNAYVVDIRESSNIWQALIGSKDTYQWVAITDAWY